METPKQQKPKNVPKKKLYSQKNDGPQILEGSERQVVLFYLTFHISRLYGKIARKNNSYKFLVGVSKIIWVRFQIAFSIELVDIALSG